MSSNKRSHWLTEDYFKHLGRVCIADLKENEHLTIELGGEQTQFIRLNGSQIRQIGTIEEAALAFSYILVDAATGDKRQSHAQFTPVGNLNEDTQEALRLLEKLRSDCPYFPVDSFARLPENHGTTRSIKNGELLMPEHAPEQLLPAMQGVDLAGIYMSGCVLRAHMNSAGQFHWFYQDSFNFDYSLYTPKDQTGSRAVKRTLAGNEWDPSQYQQDLKLAKTQIALMGKPAKRLSPGSYRVVLAPSAMSEILYMFSWGCVSERAIRKGESPLRHLRTGEKFFSPKFNLTEDFTQGNVPRFNEQGELAPEKLAIIEKGKLVSALISPRTAQEFGLQSNGANVAEGVRSPLVHPGRLKSSELLSELGTGIYISDLHYLNWSDHAAGRITGMTRYGCFWVEGGNLISPIEDLRFDDTLFNLFGDSLVDLTEEVTWQPETKSYYGREVGGFKTPAALVSSMTFTL